MSGEREPIDGDIATTQELDLPSDTEMSQDVPGIELGLDEALDSRTVDEKIRHERAMNALVADILLEHERMEKGVAGLPTKFVRRWITHRPQKPPRF